MTGTDIERFTVHAEEVSVRYAGFERAADLTDEERVVALLSLIPMALTVVEEARDTIERLNNETRVASARAWDEGFLGGRSSARYTDGFERQINPYSGAMRDEEYRG